ncbi:hypothetical protein TBLA_0A04200 [Henningerozyma blattae CBS 6284]|uniref:Hyaluronan/mRNA-binding protein domain-containing protein n=1 Tax=Henningerozyma blattae (strain ATCC 34711 / CBS 6284 / DSM 70876 / NBRC 10599 / NRRL Y-10934 / UCD 77-7) TaxID=1071380 RepID=I2GVR4_HENB6|nr:hypothetical protein TBLA_0A04200 [Tetrapisispora blattae CBS 6284]CCH58216.1 hypothetical protein TBLA_0A04200 [Tetrapisispora blattae CBS 6284]
MSNPFDLLGNDVEDADVVVLPPKEIVKKTTSSKKTDTPPPSANPARANKNRSAKQSTGNDRALKDKSAGRQQNQKKEVSSNSTSKRSTDRKKTDRHSRTGKTDSKKKIDQAWGSDATELDDETAAKQDAESEIAQDAAAAAASASKQMSLQDYMQSVSGNQLNKTPETKQASDVLENAELFVKEQEVLVEPTKVKSLRSKQLKTKEFLDFDATFSDALPKNNRRAGKFNKGGKKNSKKNSPPPKTLDSMNLPSLA